MDRCGSSRHCALPLVALALCALLASVPGCSAECPTGYTADGSLCRRPGSDAGARTDAGTGADSTVDAGAKEASRALATEGSGSSSTMGTDGGVAATDGSQAGVSGKGSANSSAAAAGEGASEGASGSGGANNSAAAAGEGASDSAAESGTCTDGMKRRCGNATPPCVQGTQTCGNGMWPQDECEGGVTPVDEVCDGVDNDCDGLFDEEGDALCAPGEHCLGAMACGSCGGDADCAGNPVAACQENYCDPGARSCEQRALADGTACEDTHKCLGGNCVECLREQDCPLKHTCEANVCVKVPECGDGIEDPGEECDEGTRNSDSTDCLLNCTLSTCGDHHWNSDGTRRREECELGAYNGASTGYLLWNEYACADDCKRRYVLTECGAPSGASTVGECGGGYCDAYSRCLPACVANPIVDPMNLAPCTPMPGRQGVCGPPGRCQLRCDAGSGSTECPIGTACIAGPMGDDGKPIWSVCSAQ